MLFVRVDDLAHEQTKSAIRMMHTDRCSRKQLLQERYLQEKESADLSLPAMSNVIAIY
jgi:hypothetical protein